MLYTSDAVRMLVQYTVVLCEQLLTCANISKSIHKTFRHKASASVGYACSGGDWGWKRSTVAVRAEANLHEVTDTWCWCSDPRTATPWIMFTKIYLKWHWHHLLKNQQSKMRPVQSGLITEGCRLPPPVFPYFVLYELLFTLLFLSQAHRATVFSNKFSYFRNYHLRHCCLRAFASGSQQIDITCRQSLRALRLLIM